MVVIICFEYTDSETYWKASGMWAWFVCREVYVARRISSSYEKFNGVE